MNKIVRILILVLLNVLSLQNMAQIPSLVFHQLSIKDGLSEGTVRAIIEDKRGFMWFGTEDGLNKYDGYKFTVYKTDLQDKYSISSNNIKCFFNDSKGRLWIGTRHGLSIYDPILDQFYNFNADYYPALKHIKGDIEEVYEDAQQNYWVLTSTDGLYKIRSLEVAPERFAMSSRPMGYVALATDKKSNLYIGTYTGLLRFNMNSCEFEDLSKLYGSNYQVRDIHIDSLGNLWLATTKGLKYIDLTSSSIKHYPHNPEDNNSINGNNSIRILPDKDKLLIAIDGKGIDLFNPQTGHFYHYTKETGTQLSSNNITAIYKDSKGTLWAGTFLNGINFSNITTNFFVSVKNNSPSIKSIKSGVVTSFLKDSRGNFWISTDGGGLYVKKEGAERFMNYNAETHPAVLHSNAAISLLEDSEKNIWVSTYAGGLTRISPSGKVKIFHHDPQDSESLIWDQVKALIEYKNQIWVSSYGMGISVYNKNAGKFKQYRYDPSDPNSLPSDWAYWFFKDSRGTLWIASFEGLCKYIPEKGQFKTYQFNARNKAVDKNYVFDIYEDSRNNLWLGTNGGGLILFDRDREEFQAYTTADGLSDNTVKTIIEDNDQNLWLATNNGLTKFSINTRKAVAYTIHDGLPPVSFFFNSKYKDKEGKIYFGTNEGYLIVDPALSLETNAFPRVVLTEMRIFNVPVTPKSENSLINTHITVAKEITLPYDQNSVSFEFAALNFSIPRQDYYAYMLEGFDKDWNYTGKNRTAKYTNLDPGTYTFKVKASNNEKVWEEAATAFTLYISPPFWMTWWFRAVGLVAIAGLGIGFFYIRTRTIRKRNKLLQKKVQIRTRELQETNTVLKEQTETVLEQRKELLDKKYNLEQSNLKLEENNEFQKKLIGIISHDIRGPLQRFSSLLKVMDEDSREFVMEKLKENAEGLALLTTDLLSWVSLQSSRSEIEKTTFIWQKIWEKVAKETEPFRKEKNINLSIKYHRAGVVVLGVEPIAHASLRNILSNAIKFSETGGIIEVEIGIIMKNGKSAIRITDYGKGLDEEQVNKLIGGEGFKGMKSADLKEGAGLGMTICNDMMKRSGGLIEAASLPGSGATFFISLPIGKQPDALSPYEENKPERQEQEITSANPNLQMVSFLKNKKILLVDDDDELRWSLSKYLEKYMQVHEARSGEEALEWLKDSTPDLVLLDIRMTGISGIELCHKIKCSKDTAHVPCLVLSGETGEETRKEVFQVGANSFLPKPINSEEVLLQVYSWFESQEKLIKRFFSENLPVDELSRNEFNRQFLQSLIAFIEQNLGNPDLNVDFLAQEIGMSRSTLYRNLKGITGQTANSFIKNIRLRRSLQLLQEGQLNVSEVATEIGFSSLSYFTTSFKKHFGFSPGDLRG